MKTRIGKIAQLSKPIRDELNQRLRNGKQGPDLLKWLNALPETQEILAAKFDHKPITACNLTDWRQGGHQDWLRDQARQERLQRIAESGALMQGEGDLFENFSRLALAELAIDLDSLDAMKDPDARWQRLRELCRELARLQNAYNRNRQTDLAWTKRNDRNSELETENLEPETQNPQPETANSEPKTPLQTFGFVPDCVTSCGTPVRYIHHASCGCICRKCHSKDGHYPYWDAERDAALWNGSGIIQPEKGESFYSQHWPCDCTCQRCDSGGRAEPPDKARKSVFRTTWSTKCNCHGTCKKCHAPDSEYPLAEVLQDDVLMQQQDSANIRQPNGVSKCRRHSLCECPCEECERTKQLEESQFALEKS